MKNILFILAIFASVLVCFIIAAPAEEKDSNKESKSAFGPAFDEIVVESTLQVKRKPPTARTGRNENITSATEKKIVKRQTKHNKRHPVHYTQNTPFSNNFSGAAANAQAQSFISNGPFGSFGASAAGSQTQSFGFGPAGLTSAAAFSGSQQYKFGDKVFDINFGNSFGGANGNSANGASVTVTGPNGFKRQL